jgi:hypothetical protein
MRRLILVVVVVVGCERSKEKAQRAVMDPVASRGQAQAVGRISFGKPTVKIAYETTSIFVEVSNRTETSITCTLNAIFKRGDDILMVAPGFVNDIPPRGVKTAEFGANEVPTSAYDKITLEESGCF